MADYPRLASHEENLKYYDGLTTASLEAFLPHAQEDMEEARRRLTAVEEILRRRREDPRPCPYDFAHTRHWCGHETCRES
ncbi:hypothetical protein [Streptomyces hydrogenans]|uniref:Uncharacterized protein n=1 Tax=Streptomyces hydrogenans TaxID=1873719 RepID=A0ABQ3PJI1_9ACTN|nr:hypothetical protein [Streptomyces hydrogenans]GHG10224.1 hypothetical protein GCM10018784_23670 [Streptomyces hydrogenans]GHI25181.1 hypothetical protein Shyd_65520 [Streptomyces hydrogenans]